MRRSCLWRAFVVNAVFPALALLARLGAAQDTRVVTEPIFPPTCQVYPAPLQSSANGPIVGSSQGEQAMESFGEAQNLAFAFKSKSCSAGQAVELSLGVDPSYNSFLLDPFSIPAGMSLIIDGGVTVYATRDPSRFQVEFSPSVCGTTKKDNPINGGCLPFITLSENSGIYGYGVLDGQGNQPIFQADPTTLPVTWWDLITTDKKHDKGTQEESPVMISAGNVADIRSSHSNFVFYKFTIRNPQYHIVDLGGLNQTVWGVKIQAPWNVPNTDGLDIHASNVTVYDTTISNGDQEIAISSSPEEATSNISIDHFRGYNKGGITILGNDGAFSNIFVNDVYITGDLPQVSSDSVNGLAVKDMQHMITSFTQALPNSSNDLKALQITTNINPNPASSTSALISNVTYQGVCIQDIVKPIVIAPVVDYVSTDVHLPVLQGVTFKDIHVLPATMQLPLTSKGVGLGEQGLYQVTLKGFPQPAGQNQYINQFTFDNVVFDDLESSPRPISPLTSLGSIDAEGNNITYQTNAYPTALTQLAAPYTPSGTQQALGGTVLYLNGNTTDSGGASTDRSLAYTCPSGAPPFVSGELFLSTSVSNNAQSVSIPHGSSVTLNAVVQPIMTQSSWYVEQSYGVTPGLLAVGSPALTNPITFFEGSTPIGTASLSANGTLASVTLNDLTPGTHTYTAQYPADHIYATLDFGSVTVTVLSPVPTSTTLIASPTAITAGTNLTLNVSVAPASPASNVPTGSVTFTDGSAALSTVQLDSGGEASYVTSLLSEGKHSVTAAYSGDANFAASTSSAVTVVVNAQPTPDFALELLPSALTLTKFAPAIAVLTVTSENGFNAPVSFACSGAPAGTSCAFSPPSLTPSSGGSTSTTLALSSALNEAKGGSYFSLTTWAFSVGSLLLVSARRKAVGRLRLLSLFIAVGLMNIIGGCAHPASSATTSRITVTATSGAVMHSADVDLTYVTTQ